jgi:RND family efflux transporter MFP subunit
MSRNFIIVLTVSIAIGLVPWLARAGDNAPGDKSSDVIPLDNCEVEYEDTTAVGTGGGTTGFLIFQQCHVKLGDRVKARQIIGQMADGELQAEYASSRAKAESDIGVRLNEAELTEATLKVRRVDRLIQRDKRFVGAEEDIRLRVDADVARLQVEMARYDRAIAKLRVRELEAQLNARKIFAPHDGVVVELYKKPGQTVLANEPVIHVANPDLLRIIGYLNVDDYGRVAVGQKVQVTAEPDSLSSNGNESPWMLTGVISFIDRRVDPKTRTCKVHAAVKNEKELLPAGIEVRMEIFAGKSKIAATPHPITAAPVRALAATPQQRLTSPPTQRNSSPPTQRLSSPQPFAGRSRSLPPGAGLETTPSTP